MQVLQHVDAGACFGTGKVKRPPLKSPVSVIYACRGDDALMLGDMARWCEAAAVGPHGAG